MKIRSAHVGLVAFCCIVPLLLACEEQKPKSETTAAPPVVPTASEAPTPAPAPAAEKPSSAAEKTSARPAKIETEVTDARRAAIEAAYPNAKGFLVAAELEAKLKADKRNKDKKTALSSFDRAARGKWVLFSGPLVNLTDDGFDLGIVYTAQIANDPLGMSRQFFEVTMSEVEGYAKDAFKPGNLVVVLAKYTGNGKAGPGHELVATGAWK